jgi:hypothetical protein
MDDETLAPFVDALASALIIMVLVALFFLLQSATSLSSSAKLMTVSTSPVDEDRPLFNPIVYRKPISVDFADSKIVYLLNFELKEEDRVQLRTEILSHPQVSFTFYSNDADTKVTANMIHLLVKLALPPEIKVKTSIEKSDSSLSKVKWELS